MNFVDLCYCRCHERDAFNRPPVSVHDRLEAVMACDLCYVLHDPGRRAWDETPPFRAHDRQGEDEG